MKRIKTAGLCLGTFAALLFHTTVFAQMPQAPGVPPPSSDSSHQGAGGSNRPDYKALAKKGMFHFDFNKAQITDIVKIISEITQKNFIIPDKIRGQQLTIMSPTPVNANEAYQAFLSALEVNDITLVKVGKFYKLIASQEGAKNPTPFYEDNEGVPPYDNIVTKLIRVEHADANMLSQILRSFTSKFAQIAVYNATNSLIISEYASNLVRLDTIIKQIDSPGSNSQVHLLPIKYASSTEIVQKMVDLFDLNRGPTQHSAGSKKGSGGSEQFSISKLIPDDRTNQIIVVATEYAFNQVKELAQKLDVPVGEETGQVRVIRLQNANADDLAQVLSSLATGSGGTRQPKGQPAAPRPAGGSPASLFEGDVRVSSDKATNSLLVIASPHDFRSVKRMVDQLDVARRQVLIEMAILEVSVKNDLEVGTEWYGGLPPSVFNNAGPALKGGLGLFSSPKGGGLAGAAAQGIPGLITAFGGAIGGIAGSPVQLNGPNGTTFNIPSFAVLLKALQTSSNSNLISTPYLLATDNEEAQIEVGEKLPFASGLPLSGLLGAAGGAAGAAGGAAGLGSLLSGGQVQRIDVTLNIKMTPHINQSNKVLLEIDEQFEDLVRTEDVLGQRQPVTAKRNMKSKIVIEDQQTVVLGGLMRDKVTESSTKYPILGDIPILGWLFKSKNLEKSKSNLLVVITPYIIRRKSDFEVLYKRKMAEHKAFADLFYSNYKEYRAQIDYSHKNGALAMISQAVKREMSEIENGGQGDIKDVVVIPHGNADEPANNDAKDPKKKTDAIDLPHQGGDKTAPVETTPSNIPPKEDIAPPVPQNPSNEDSGDQ